MSRRRTEELSIISDSPKRRPYASKISFIIGGGSKYNFDGEACLLFENDYITKIKPENSGRHDRDQQLQTLTATIEGFSTASEAEKMGLKLTLSVLWAAISINWPIKLAYHTPQPCMVFDRTISKGLTLSCFATATVTSPPKMVSGLLEQILSKDIELDKNLLLSMELFASAKMEMSERAKFISLVSSIEPLATAKSYENKELEELVDKLILKIKDGVSLDKSAKDSITTRAKKLCQESVSQSIRRLVGKYIPNNKEVLRKIDEAYKIRSRILHTGSFDADLDEKSSEIEEIIRFIYSRIIGEDLLFPVKL